LGRVGMRGEKVSMGSRGLLAQGGLEAVFIATFGALSGRSWEPRAERLGSLRVGDEFSIVAEAGWVRGSAKGGRGTDWGFGVDG
jgi:hypothetical protein